MHIYTTTMLNSQMWLVRSGWLLFSNSTARTALWAVFHIAGLYHYYYVLVLLCYFLFSSSSFIGTCMADAPHNIRLKMNRLIKSVIINQGSIYSCWYGDAFCKEMFLGYNSQLVFCHANFVFSTFTVSWQAAFFKLTLRIRKKKRGLWRNNCLQLL